MNKRNPYSIKIAIQLQFKFCSVYWSDHASDTYSLVWGNCGAIF